MPVTLTVKNVPDELAERLRARAKRNHRSLQGELLAILEKAEGSEAPRFETLDDLYEYARSAGFRYVDEAAEIVREMRESR